MNDTVAADLAGFRAAAPTEARYRGAVGRYFRAVEEEFVLAWIGAPGARVLDLGCGTGRLFPALRRGNNLVIGADISTDMLGSARRAASAGTGLVAGDFYRLPFADGTLDTVAAIGTFHLTRDIDRVFREIGRAMRPGGSFVFTCWNAKPWLPRRLFQGARAAPHRFEDVARHLDAAGFEVADAMSTFYFPSNLFWAGCKLLRAEAPISRWVDLAIAVNRYFLARTAWRLRGAHFIVRARKR